MWSHIVGLCFDWRKSKLVLAVVVLAGAVGAVYSWIDLYHEGQENKAVEHLKRGFALYDD